MTLTQTGWKLLGGNRLRVGRHTFKFVLSRALGGEIKTVTIKRDRCGDLWVCFSVVEDVQPTIPQTGSAVGIDFGLKQFLTCSDGQIIASPQHLRASLRENGKQVIKVERFFPSSKLCSGCGTINDELTLSERTWRCGCGEVHDRDVNAAKNILERALSSRVGDVRPRASGAIAA